RKGARETANQHSFLPNDLSLNSALVSNFFFGILSRLNSSAPFLLAPGTNKPSRAACAKGSLLTQNTRPTNEVEYALSLQKVLWQGSRARIFRSGPALVEPPATCGSARPGRQQSRSQIAPWL